MSRQASLLTETKELAKKYAITPTKRFGQNFLTSELVYMDIMEAADIHKEDRVLEVGPGLGFLTFALAEQAGEVVAVEIDRNLTRILPGRVKEFGYTNVRIIEGDILDFPNIKGLENWADKPFKVVANLPYNITSVFLRKFLEKGPRPQTLTLLLQKEVAERICAKAGKMSILALSVQFYGQPEFKFRVDKSDFWPQPEVQSAVLTIKVNDQPALPLADVKPFWRLIKISFAAKRKMLKKNLAAALPLDIEDFGRILAGLGLNPEARAQDLGLDDWLRLFALLKRDVL
ncbi:MAG: 16S rRNA (adenine(1518)-N(6)/adenine(1519)-N(6))-dimethyltransferase RsmA [Candidatus Falkowbacteria bacterium]